MEVKQFKTVMTIFWLQFFSVRIKYTLQLKGETSGNGWVTNGNQW